jgi:hypothetical protein
MLSIFRRLIKNFHAHRRRQDFQCSGQCFQQPDLAPTQRWAFAGPDPLLAVLNAKFPFRNNVLTP